ncbi:MAG: tRNA (adenosine(37)-N6)-dimethylallyltransferase MiaA [Nitrospirae bacterium]|nr:tRNA (adenosine(37)-N6)-dimethylallyltransferase MiaA [Nitrospirota bacterium]
MTPDIAASRPNLIAVTGPTATGKTAFAVRLARRLGGEIVSADSRQVYRGMDIGTGKDIAEYSTGGYPVPYHLIDIVEPSENFSLHDYQKRAFDCIRGIWRRGRLPILCGGTGLYVDSVLRGYRLVEAPENPVLRAGLEPLSLDDLAARLRQLRPDHHTSSDFRKRDRLIRAIEIAVFTDANPGSFTPPPEIRPLVIWLTRPRPELVERIGARLGERLDGGMIDEVQRLNAGGISWERLESFGLEYRFIADYLRGRMTMEELYRDLFTAIRRFAKRQETWFRGMERKGVVIHRLSPDDFGALERLLAEAGCGIPS